MKKILSIAKTLITIFLVFFILALFLSTIPYIKQPTVSENSKKDLLHYDDFLGEDFGSDQATLIENPIDTFTIRQLLIKEAKEVIYMSYYLIHDDPSSHALLGELLFAADRGVLVNITIDGKIPYTSPSSYQKLISINEHPNITVRLYNQPKISNIFQWQSMLHDKYLIIDQQYALLGGNNLGDRFFAPTQYQGQVTEDRDVLITNVKNDNDSVINDLINYAREFNQLAINRPIDRKSRKDYHNFLMESARNYPEKEPQFYLKSLDDYIKVGHPTKKISLIHNPTHAKVKEPWLAYQLKELVDQSSTSVIIQTPYATGNQRFINVAQKNQDKNIQMITNSIGSSPNVMAFSNYIKNRDLYLNASVEIFEFQNESRSIHAKSWTFDDSLSAVGTYNLDDRSTFVSTEMMLVIDSEKFNQELKSSFNNTIAMSTNIGANTGATEIEVSLFKKLLIELLSIFTRIFQHII